MANTPNNGKLALVVGGGPAPGINGVISSVTIEACNHGMEVIGFLDGYKHAVLEPDKFDPNRFLPEQAAERHRYAYFPFGGGPRICIGNHMAMLEGPMVLAALASRFRFTLVEGQRIEADPTFTLRPKYGVQVVLRKRST